MFESFWTADHRHRLRGYQRVWVLIWITCTTVTGTLGWADESTKVPRGTLQLRRGDFVAGRLVDHANPNQLAWQHPSFDSKFVFPSRAVTSAAFDGPPEVTPAAGDFCVELTNGDRWYGSVASIDRRTLTLRSPDVGKLVIQRERLRRLFRWENGETVLYSGPGSLTDWQQSGSAEAGAVQAWQDRDGQLLTDHTLTSIFADVGLPAQAEIEIALSWSGAPNFAIAFGVDEAPASVDRAFRLEVWNQTLVLIRESQEAAEVLALGTLAEFDHRLWLSIALDQITGRAVVYSSWGEKLGELHLEGETQQSLPGIRVENIAGNVQLESLQVITGRAVSGSPLESDLEPSTLEQADGIHFQLRESGTHQRKWLAGEWLRVEDGAWIVSEGDQERTIEPADVLAADFRIAPQTPPQESAEEDAASLRVVTHGGIRATGSLQKIENETLYLQAEGVDGPLALRVADLRSLTVSASELGRPSQAGASLADWTSSQEQSSQEANRTDLAGQVRPQDAEDNSPQPSSRIGRLELAGTRLHGRLVDAKANDAGSAIRFQPLVAAESAALRVGASGRLVYRDREPEPPAHQQPQPRPQPRPANRGILGAFAEAFGGSRGSGLGAGPQLAGTSLHLRSGDVLQCQIERIDAEGVVFESSLVGATRLPHDQLRAVALASGRMPAIDPSKRERLLTVPRMRKATPPSHLIVSSDGDFLRGRLDSLDAETLRFENRLETIEIPRRVVTQIIWFHPDDLLEVEPDEQVGATPRAVRDADPPASPASQSGESDSPDGLRVQTVHRNGVRVSCEPRQVGGGELIGESPQLGVCLIRLAEIDQLLIGREIEAAVDESPYHDWRLTHAPEPKVLQEGETPGMRSAGVDSPLLGTVAPDFDLELLAGGTFRLSEQRGKIVVLDFWATWCGPCIQSMPQVEEAVAAFPDDGVILVAVNLQESAEQIRGVLERLKRNPTVALDIDGVVASQYHATAIPQTVVIDRQGRVTRLFIGGGAKLGEHLKGAIEEVR